ncbi:ABC transporter ATP-binding protein [Corallincola luteus]|uniref:ABC transporter ATP-binding protein n=1 Tax=Corallincola luteus TaxID=1775177 RepID=A0ABY2AQM9_9GAMM|nr:ABC transporter ATP-binding protein [Corallincola luteus]TCI05229.1 ABC transporter ATP-binding protein [Corallincola luteus]
MATLNIKQIRKRYGKSTQEILKGIDISIDNGEFLILVGPSGCGKSTLMNMIAGLEEVSDGQILIDNQDVTHVAPKDRDIAMVFQSYALYPNMTVRQNIQFGLEIRKMPAAEIEAEVERVANLLQIDHLLDRKPSQLSGGQQQRVAMGRALSRRPKIYLFDEPLSNLDAKLRVEMRTEVKKLHQRLGTTIVYVTHDQIEAMTLADRIAVMKDGELLQLGTPKQVYETPANMFVAGFIGSPSMNFIDCLIKKDENGLFTELANSQQQITRLPAPDYMIDYLGKSVVLGLRPEQITTPQPHKQTDKQVTRGQFEVLVTEPTGPDVIVEVQANDQEISCRIDPEHPLEIGQPIELMFDCNKAVYFDKSTEQRICPQNSTLPAPTKASAA